LCSSGEKKSDYINIRKKQKNNQGDIHRTVTNFVYDVSVFKNSHFPVLHHKYDSSPFSEYFHLHFEAKSEFYVAPRRVNLSAITSNMLYFHKDDHTINTNG